MKRVLASLVCGLTLVSMTVNGFAGELIKRGMRGDEVREVQELLVSAGYLPEDGADGKFGPKTEQAVIAFQEKNGLDATGIVGDGTLHALREGEAPETEAAAAAEAAEAEKAEDAAAEATEAEKAEDAANEETEADEAEDAAADETEADEAEDAVTELTDAAETAAAVAELADAVEMAAAVAELTGAAETEDAAAEETGDEAVKALAYALVFPSWDPDSETLDELVSYVSAVIDEENPAYIEPADRIATFDMDGTILCEKAPVYVDYCLTMYRVLDDPTFKATEEERDAMQQIRDHAYTYGETFHPKTITKRELVASAFAGMTPEEFRDYVKNFAFTQDAVGFEGMKYGESFYKPMIEVIDFLRANDFDVWMVSACEREVARALVEQFDFPFDHVIATDVPYVASGKGEDEAADAYNMSQEDTIVLGAPLEAVKCEKSDKPAAIAREIGKRPVLAFGNSSGDYSMLNFAESNPEHDGMSFLVVCDDTEREYGNDEKAAEYYAEAEKEGWTAISMANDWTDIYGEGVEKTALPGAAEEKADAA